MSAFGIGFIGCGSYANALADTAKKSDFLRLNACFDTLQDSSKAFGERHGIPAFSTLEALLEQTDVQGVIIATPNNAHLSGATAAAAAGKHVFVDKPIANKIEDALAIIDATEGKGLTLAIGHNGRRNAGHRKMKQMIDSGEIGTPITVESNFSHSGGLGLTPQQWRFYRDECPGLPLMQLGVHFADTVQYLLGDVLEVSSFMSHIATPADNNDVTVNLLKFDKGLLGYLGSNYATPPVYYVNVYGTGANLYCEGGGSLYVKWAGSDRKEEVPLTPTDPMLEELEEFARCAMSGEKPEVDGRAGLMALAVVQAALRSHEERRPINIQEMIEQSLS